MNVKTARSWRGMVTFEHLVREGRMTVTIARRELLVALGGTPSPKKDRPALGGVAFSLGAGSGGARVLSHLLQSSSASRFTAGASEFFILSQSGER